MYVNYTGKSQHVTERKEGEEGCPQKISRKKCEQNNCLIECEKFTSLKLESPLHDKELIGHKGNRR